MFSYTIPVNPKNSLDIKENWVALVLLKSLKASLITLKPPNFEY